MPQHVYRRRRSDQLLLRPDRWLLGGCLVALALLAATVLNYRNTRQQEGNEVWVRHTHQVIDALTATRSHLRSAEAVQRRYLITGDPADLAGFDPEIVLAQRAVAQVRELTADNARQQARIPALEQGIQDTAAVWRETAAVRGSDGFEAARERVVGGPGRWMLEQVGQRLDEMTRTERALLEQRSQQARASFTTSLVMGVTTGVASLLLVLAFAALLKRHLDRGLADARALRQLSADLREADQRKDRFLATLAHELRNPLAPVRTAAAILKSPRLDAQRLAWVADVVQRQVGHMASLLDDLLDVARITQGKLTLRREHVALSAVVDLAIEAARPLIDRKSHRFDARLPPSPGEVVLDADPVRLSQALTNLLTNAAKYTDPGGEIVLVAQVRGPDLQLLVRDTGVGLAPEALGQVFEMFSQVDGAAGRAEGGLGIGLALTRGVVELHGGSVRAASAGPGRGSEFAIELPGTVVAAPQPQAGPASAGALPAGHYRILVADDNRDAGESLGTLLAMAGHEVRVVDSGRAAIEAARQDAPEVAFLDIGMPDLDGYAVARALREGCNGSDIALVAVTGWGQDEDRRRSLHAGFDAHLTKPVDPATVDSLLAQPVQALRATAREHEPATLPGVG